MSRLAIEIAEMIYKKCAIFGSRKDFIKRCAPLIDQKLSGVREVIEPIRAACSKPTIDGVKCLILDWNKLTVESISIAADLWESLKVDNVSETNNKGD